MSATPSRTGAGDGGKSAGSGPGVRLRAEHGNDWRALERIVKRVREGRTGMLTSDDRTKLPSLYATAVSSLSTARRINLDAELTRYLESLCAQAYLIVYSPRRGFFRSVLITLMREFPRAFRRQWKLVLLSAALMFGAALVAFVVVGRDMSVYESILPSHFAMQHSVDATTEELHGILYGGHGAGHELANFFLELFFHNVWVGLIAFASGSFFGLPTAYLMVYNGLILGAIFALYHSHCLGSDLALWILPHGIPELLAIIIFGAAGFLQAYAVLFPGTRSRLESLAERGRDVGCLLVGGIALLFLAGFVEGIFRQVFTDPATRLLQVVGIGLAVTFWLLPPWGRRARS